MFISVGPPFFYPKVYVDEDEDQFAINLYVNIYIMFE